MPTDKRCICIRMRDGDSLDVVRTILAYEAAVRGLKPGQVLSELVMSVVDVGSYPPEVRDRLAELSAEHERLSLEKFLASASE